jgi:LmbE family N-acetylglucosaminyl deacetylase
VLGHDPWQRYRLHPDHRNAGFLATDGIVAARDPHFFPKQGEAPHRPAALLLWEAEEPDHVESIVGFEERKLQALLAHRSQFRSTMRVDEEPSSVETFAARLKERYEKAGAPVGIGAAEAFKVLSDL